MRTSRFFRLSTRLGALLALLALALTTLAACGASGAGSPSDQAGLQPITIGLTYVPNIQFAPFYVADALGYYKEAGLKVTFHHHAANEDEFAALVSGKEDVIFAAGDEMAQARGHDVPVVYVANVYTTYPVALIVPADSPIHTPADLRGHTIGVPGPYGANYIGLLALLKAGNLSQSDVSLKSIGYTQVPALLSHKVDAVMGYLNNEPIAFQKASFAIRTLPVSDVQPLISNGLGALQTELSDHPDLVKAVIKATLQGVDFTIQHPQSALNLSKRYVPGLDDQQKAADALDVLQASLNLWQQGNTPGYNDPQAWQAMLTFLKSQGQLAGPVDASKAFSNDYLPK